MAFFPCCLDEEKKLSLRISREIDREIERWKKDNSKEYKLLLLGVTALVVRAPCVDSVCVFVQGLGRRARARSSSR